MDCISSAHGTLLSHKDGKKDGRVRYLSGRLSRIELSLGLLILQEVTDDNKHVKVSHSGFNLLTDPRWKLELFFQSYSWLESGYNFQE